MRKQPMTTEELFLQINEILKKNGQLPDILDYGLATSAPVPIRTYEFQIGNNLDYGGNEGIYLDLWIWFYEDGKKQYHQLGTYKTLREDAEGMHQMAALLADFIVLFQKYVNDRLDDFTWQGADVHAVDENEKQVPFGWSCRTMEAALKKKDEMLQKYPKVCVRDNATKKEIIFENGGNDYEQNRQ